MYLKINTFFPFSKACHGDTSLQNLMAKFAGGKYSEKEMHRILNTEDSASGNVFTSKTEITNRLKRGVVIPS